MRAHATHTNSISTRTTHLHYLHARPLRPVVPHYTPNTPGLQVNWTAGWHERTARRARGHDGLEGRAPPPTPPLRAPCITCMHASLSQRPLWLAGENGCGISRILPHSPWKGRKAVWRPPSPWGPWGFAGTQTPPRQINTWWFRDRPGVLGPPSIGQPAGSLTIHRPQISLHCPAPYLLPTHTFLKPCRSHDPSRATTHTHWPKHTLLPCLILLTTHTIT